MNNNYLTFIVYEIELETGKLTYPLNAFVQFSGPARDATGLYEEAEAVAVRMKAKNRNKNYTIVKVF